MRPLIALSLALLLLGACSKPAPTPPSQPPVATGPNPLAGQCHEYPQPLNQPSINLCYKGTGAPPSTCTLYDPIGPIYKCPVGVKSI